MNENVARDGLPEEEIPDIIDIDINDIPEPIV